MGILNRLLDTAYEKKELEHLVVWHRVVGVYVFVLLVWGLYRLLFRFPVWFEEVVLKALVFGAPVFWNAFRKDKWSFKNLGLTTQNLFPSVYMGLGLGMVLGLLGQLGNFLRHGGLQLSAYGLGSSGEIGGFLLLSLVTAFWEELLFAGYFLQRLATVVPDEWNRVLLTAGMFVLLHAPALVFIQRVQPLQGIAYAILLLSVGVGNAIVMLRTKNLAAPILTHALWGVTVYLFR